MHLCHAGFNQDTLGQYNAIYRALVADLVQWYLPVHSVVQFRLVNKEWKAWCDQNLLYLAKELRKDQSLRNWYFPSGFFDDHPNIFIRALYGLHMYALTEHEDTLPDLTFFLIMRLITIL